jgi:hypothetical protein
VTAAAPELDIREQIARIDRTHAEIELALEQARRSREALPHDIAKARAETEAMLNRQPHEVARIIAEIRKLDRDTGWRGYLGGAAAAFGALTGLLVVAMQLIGLLRG